MYMRGVLPDLSDRSDISMLEMSPKTTKNNLTPLSWDSVV